MDEDLDQLSREQLVAEVKKLRQGIRCHRNSSGHDLCWYHPELWSLLPEKTEPAPNVPAWPEFMNGCITYRQSLDFSRLVAEWKRETQWLSSTTAITTHAAFLKIVEMGLAAIPWILRELQREPSFLFMALAEITGENPTEEKDSGKIQELVDAWIDWGQKAGYI